MELTCPGFINKSHSSAKGNVKWCGRGDGGRGETCRTHVKHKSHALPLSRQTQVEGVGGGGGDCWIMCMPLICLLCAASLYLKYYV